MLGLFAVERGGREVVGRRQFVARIATGSPPSEQPPFPVPGQPQRVFARFTAPSVDAVLLSGPHARRFEDGLDLDGLTWIEERIRALPEPLVTGGRGARGAVPIEAGPNLPAAADVPISLPHGAVFRLSATVPTRLLG